MVFKHWNIPDIDKIAVSQLADECEVEPFVALMAYSRGYTDAFALDMFLSKEIFDIDPFDLPDMEKAAQRINTAIANGEKILIYGDYDCDGITSTALMYKFLLSLEANAEYFIPNRQKDGYGMNIAAVEKAANDGVNLIVTVDNGINCNEEVKKANELGIDVVITDHHLPLGNLPDAVAVVDPHIENAYLEFKDFAGVGVAFLTAMAVSGVSPQKMFNEYGDLVALGTVADVMPLKAENRCFVSTGIKQIMSGKNLGISALIKSAGLVLNNLTAESIAFGISPRINAAGRMGDASRAVELLVTNDENNANEIAAELDAENRRRQEFEKEIALYALNDINENKYYNDRIIVVCGVSWQEGVLGIAAGKLAEYFGKPIILLTAEKDANIAKGSARSVGNFPIFDAICAAGDLLVKYGGHDMAAGLSVEKDKIGEFRKKINEFALELDYPVPEIKIDCKLNPAAIDFDLINVLEPLQPYGTGNPTPVFGLFKMTLNKIIPIGNRKHLRLICEKNGVSIAAVFFKTEPENFPFCEGETVDLAVTLQCGEYQGLPQLNVLVKDVRYSGRNDDDIITELAKYDMFMKGKISIDIAKQLAFERSDMATVYKLIKSGKNSMANLVNACTDLSFSKIGVIIDCMEELGLATCEGFGLYRKIHLSDSGKVELENSKIYSDLKDLSVGV